MNARTECRPPTGTPEGARCVLRAPTLPVWKGRTRQSAWVWRGGEWVSDGETGRIKMSPAFAAVSLYEHVATLD